MTFSNAPGSTERTNPAVAIPALFGYNWLASQIKNVSADMQVFADEFLTKAAELHSR